MPRRGFRSGDAVRVKKGVACPDRDGLSLAGWQGRVIDVTETEDGGTLVGVAWDGPTLKQIPVDYVQESEREGLDWGESWLSAEELTPARPRGSAGEARRVRDVLERTYYWFGLGERGRRIYDVIAGADPDDPMASLIAWGGHLRKALTFPFRATLSEDYGAGRLRRGNAVQVQDLSVLDDELGIIVDVQGAGELRVLPLCDLAVVGKTSPNHLAVEDYRCWFADR